MPASKATPDTAISLSVMARDRKGALNAEDAILREFP
jgi:hypothetical protein